jgi:hypothetical protein
MFRSPSATILRVYSSKEYRKNCVCMWGGESGVNKSKTFIVSFNTVHPEDDHRRRPKQVGVINKQRI